MRQYRDTPSDLARANGTYFDPSANRGEVTEDDEKLIDVRGIYFEPISSLGRVICLSRLELSFSTYSNNQFCSLKSACQTLN